MILQFLYDWVLPAYVIAMPVGLALNAMVISEVKYEWKRCMAYVRNNGDSPVFQEKINESAKQIVELRRWRWKILSAPVYFPYVAIRFLGEGLVVVFHEVKGIRFSISDHRIESEIIKQQAREAK